MFCNDQKYFELFNCEDYLKGMMKILDIVNSLWNFIQDIIKNPVLKPMAVPVRVKDTRADKPRRP